MSVYSTYSAASGESLYFRVMTDVERARAELVLHFAYRGSIHRRKGAARHIINMVWLYRSPIPVRKSSTLLVQMIFSCLHRTASK